MTSTTLDAGHNEPDNRLGIDQCKVAGLTCVGMLGPTHALLQGGTGNVALATLVLLTGSQAFAVVGIISAIFVAWKIRHSGHLDSLIIHTPVSCCCAAGTLLIAATCIVHWKASCTIGALVGVLLIVAYRGKVCDFVGPLAGGCIAIISRLRGPRLGGCIAVINRLRGPRTANGDLEMGSEGEVPAPLA